MNQVQSLYQYRKSISTKPFAARGKQVNRCQSCLVAMQHCICEHKQLSQCDVGFVLLMSDKEILKPSNTGKLIADVIPNTFAFLWHRTEVNQQLIALLNNQLWQPILVFPDNYALPEQPNYEISTHTKAKKPLFILLDGSWREARRMYRKSPYLHDLPMLSLSTEALIEHQQNKHSRYQLRHASLSGQLATAEVAAQILHQFNLTTTAQHLDLWFDVFVYHYQKSVCQKNTGNTLALEQYQTFIDHL